LSAVGKHEGHFGQRSDWAEGGFGLGVEEDATDTVAEFGAAGFAEANDFVAFGFQVGGKTAKLGGFARSIQTFESNEETT
jgi:hypothetical protein